MILQDCLFAADPALNHAAENQHDLPIIIFVFIKPGHGEPLNAKAQPVNKQKCCQDSTPEFRIQMAVTELFRRVSQQYLDVRAQPTS